jgi:hypothetical protein
MFRTVRKTLLALAVVALLMPVAKVAFAQNLYNVTHFDTHPDITNTTCGGTADNPDCNITGPFGSSLPTHGGAIRDNMVRMSVGTGADRCANIYVYDDDEQLIECCACPVSSNGFLQLSTEDNLTANPFDSVGHTRGLIKVVSSLGSPCFNSFEASSAGAPYTTAANIREWIDHVPTEPSATPGEGDFPGPFRNIVESVFLAVPTASAAELANLQTTCNTVLLNGTGKGACTCGDTTTENKLQ